MNKSGLSTIVITLLLIVLAMVAIGIIWVVVQNVLDQGTDDVDLGKLTTSLSLVKATVINSDALDVVVKRKAGKGSLLGINFILDNGENTEIIENLTVLNELDQRTFRLDPEMNAGDIKSVSIAPIFGTGEGDKSVGNVLDEYEIPICDPVCTGQDICQDGQCVCVPKTCADLGYECGAWDDGCGVSINCGSLNGACPSGEICCISGDPNPLCTNFTIGQCYNPGQ